LYSNRYATVPTFASGGVNLRFALMQNPPPPEPSQRLQQFEDLGAGGLGGVSLG
jgi:hypothetical protein